MTSDPAPDLTLVMALNPFAPRAARHHIGLLGHPSPDLRDAIQLLTSDIVSVAVEQAPGDSVELRVWMRREVVRVEMHGPPAAVGQPPTGLRGHGSLVLDRIADRWRLEAHDDDACVWFEIDRRAASQPAYAAQM